MVRKKTKTQENIKKETPKTPANHRSRREPKIAQQS